MSPLRGAQSRQKCARCGRVVSVNNMRRHRQGAKCVRPALPEKKLCPDGGVCHHACGRRCYRVDSCAPLRGVYPRNEWPDAIREAQGKL